MTEEEEEDIQRRSSACSQTPPCLVCTPREKGTMIHPPLRLTGALPLFVILPITSDSTVLAWN